MEQLEKFFHDFKASFTILLCAILGIGAKIIVESQEKKITLKYFVSGFLIGLLGSWVMYLYVQAHPEYDTWKMPLMILASILSYPTLKFIIDNVGEFLNAIKDKLINKIKD